MAIIEVNWRPGRDDLRKFGYLCLVVFGALGAWVYVRHSAFGVPLEPTTARTLAGVLWAVAVGCGVGSLVAPGILKPLYIVLTAISFPIGFVVSHVVMALLFYGLLTPVALVFRLIGRDALNRRFDRDRPSYWEPRRQVSGERYFRQF